MTGVGNDVKLRQSQPVLRLLGHPRLPIVRRKDGVLAPPEDLGRHRAALNITFPTPHIKYKRRCQVHLHRQCRQPLALIPHPFVYPLIEKILIDLRQAIQIGVIRAQRVISPLWIALKLMPLLGSPARKSQTRRGFAHRCRIRAKPDAVRRSGRRRCTRCWQAKHISSKSSPECPTPSLDR